MILLVILIFGYILSFICWPIQEHYTLLSNWAMHLAFFSIFNMWRQVNRVNFKNEPMTMGRNHFLYSISLPANLFIMTTFYAISHRMTPKKDWEGKSEIEKVSTYWIHTVPAICCVINVCISNIVLSRKLLDVILTLGFFYSIINCLITKASGKPIYGFLPWKNFWNSAQLCFFILSYIGAFYWVLWLIDEKMKPKLVKKREEMSKVFLD